MSDHLDRAAEVIAAALRSIWEADASWNPEARDIARALEEAGLLVSPERDAAVAAKALRAAAEALDDMQTPDNDEHRRVLLDPAMWLTERADRIEREAVSRVRTPEEMARDLVEADDRAPLDLGDIAELIRARDAEVREAARAEALAGFVEERRTREDGYAGAAWDTTGRTQTTTTFMRPGTRERRLVGPWEPEEER